MSDVERARTLFFEALAFLDSQDFAGAEKLLRDALTFAPGSTAILTNLSVALLRQEKISEARAIAEKTISLDAGNVDAHLIAADCLAREGRFAEALDQCDAVIALDPNVPEAHSNRGNALSELGRNADALASYDRALALRPDFADAIVNRGNALRKLKRHDEALAAFDRALAIAPAHAGALLGRGNVLNERMRHADALSAYDRALAAAPDLAEAWLGRGNTLNEFGRHDEALAAFDKASALAPGLAGVQLGRGNVLLELRRHDDAFAAFDGALALAEDRAGAWLGRGNTLLSLKRFEDAADAYDRALALDSGLAAAWLGRGNVLNALKRFEDASAAFDRALAQKPDYAEAWLGRGNMFMERAQYDEALRCFARAQEFKPGLGEAHFNEANCRLLLGDTARGWDKYEWRWQTRQMRKARRDFPQPLWNGEDTIAGKTILLHAEQGFGDTLQFCRYVALVSGKGAHVILEVDAPLRSLMSGLAGAQRTFARGEPLPAFDLHCPLGSLPRAFGSTLQTIPARVPYLSAPDALVQTWKERLQGGGGLRVGLAWAGNPDGPQDRYRSIGLGRLLAVTAVQGVQFVGLQKDLRAGDADILKNNPGILWLGNELRDFADTAAVMANLDLIVSSDTSVVHLAGALGKPVWILLAHYPDWRWLLNRDDSPWYPTARLFRQPATDDWDSVTERVTNELRARHLT